ncbi:MAG TPA: dihydrodipicolinate synthase family protein [Acidimicrobiales bacterium]|nr:dihydrodipicolinate synthase family protein [Acidimicrobiales bacterium]
MPAPFTGVAVALVSLFRDDGGLDADATAAHARRLADAGIQAVVVAGSTGEASSLEPGERGRLLEAVGATVDVPLLCGTGAASARQARALTEEAVAAGADGVLALSPPGGRGLAGYYQAVREAAGALPVLAYHFPALAPPGVPVDQLELLPVDGLKDSSGDPMRLLAELDRLPGALYVGSPALLSMAAGVGCAGAILALANLDPEGCLEAFSGDHRAQRRPGRLALEAEEDFPAGLKRLLSRRHGTSPVCRI